MRVNDRERMLTLLRGVAPDRVPWFGDMAYWYYAAQMRGDLPPQYEGDGLFQLHRDLGLGFYLQGYFPFTETCPGCEREVRREGDEITTVIRTPRGALTEVSQYLPLSFSTGCVKHFVETPADLPAFEYYLEHLTYAPDYGEAQRRRELVDGQGVVLCYAPRSPFMQLVTTYTGLTNLVYLLMDEPERMARLLALMERQHDIAAALAADSPAECVMIPENLSSEVVGERYYLEYLRPYERRWVEGIRERGKFSFIHMDGTLRGLLRQVAETGFDVIEAATPLPAGDIPMEEAAELVGGRSILWGGLPGALFSPTAREEDFIAHTIRMLELMRREPRFVLGVADQVPPDGLLERVGMVAPLCERFGRYS